MDSAELPELRDVRLVCIEKRLESWVLADNEAVAAFLSTPEHPRRVAKVKHPDRVKDPEAVLNREFRQTRLGKYRDLDHADRIVEAADLKRLRRSASFKYIEQQFAKGP